MGFYKYVLKHLNAVGAAKRTLANSPQVCIEEGVRVNVTITPKNEDAGTKAALIFMHAANPNLRSGPLVLWVSHAHRPIRSNLGH